MYKVYGPYTRKSDGRQYVNVHYYSDDGTQTRKRTVSYPKWIMEQHLGRELDSNLETVDHIDRDFTNNDLSNLRVIPRKQHSEEDAPRVNSPVVTCIWCGEEFEGNWNDLYHNRLKGKAGPFCSKSCVGKYGAEAQNGRVDKIIPDNADDFSLDKRDYYDLKGNKM